VSVSRVSLHSIALLLVANLGAVLAVAAIARSQPTTLPVKLDTMEVAQAVMVTIELDFGPKLPSIGDALRQIERRYAADDGQGRTFAILDAYGQPTQEGKLHISMHVSLEKPGLGLLVFRRTGDTLWTSRIVQRSKPGGRPKNLGIFIDDGRGNLLTVNGSDNPKSILDARIREHPLQVRDVWPIGTEREITFLYSACGCPVKVMARRTGERIVRTSEMPVIFPDDPPVVKVVEGLFKW